MSFDEEQRKFSKAVKWDVINEIDLQLSNPSLHGFTITKSLYGVSDKYKSEIARDVRLHEQVRFRFIIMTRTGLNYFLYVM